MWRDFREISYGGMDDEFKFHLVKWATVGFSISERCLDVKN